MSRIRGTWGAVVVVVVMALCWKAEAKEANSKMCRSDYCLSWRLGVETNNVPGWRTVPTQCLRYVEAYMLFGQYKGDLSFVVDNIISYADNITLSGNASDAWILDVDDTCISNLLYYSTKKFGVVPYDPVGFKEWALRGKCPAIPDVLRLFKMLIQKGFKVILLTGRDEETFGAVTTQNLQMQGYREYERLILRNATYRGLSAIIYKSMIRKQLVEEGYKIWGNVGDEWSDLLGECPGNRTFKIPNPMYFVP